MDIFPLKPLRDDSAFHTSEGDNQSTIDSEGFKGGTRGAPIMPRDTVSRTAHHGTVGKNIMFNHHGTIKKIYHAGRKKLLGKIKSRKKISDAISEISVETFRATSYGLKSPMFRC